MTWPASLFAQFYPFVIISKCGILIPDNAAGEARPTKNNGLPQLQGTPIRAVSSLAVQVSIQNGPCSQELCKCPCQQQGPRAHVGAEVLTGVVRPHRAGQCLPSALLYEQMGCLGQKSAVPGSDVLGCNSLQMALSPPPPGHESSGTEAGLSLRACVGVLVFA